MLRAKSLTSPCVRAIARDVYPVDHSQEQWFGTAAIALLTARMKWGVSCTRIRKPKATPNKFPVQTARLARENPYAKSEAHFPRADARGIQSEAG